MTIKQFIKNICLCTSVIIYSPSSWYVDSKTKANLRNFYDYLAQESVYWRATFPSYSDILGILEYNKSVIQSLKSSSFSASNAGSCQSIELDPLMSKLYMPYYIIKFADPLTKSDNPIIARIFSDICNHAKLMADECLPEMMSANDIMCFSLYEIDILQLLSDSAESTFHTSRDDHGNNIFDLCLAMQYSINNRLPDIMKFFGDYNYLSNYMNSLPKNDMILFQLGHKDTEFHKNNSYRLYVNNLQQMRDDRILDYTDSADALYKSSFAMLYKLWSEGKLAI